MIPFPADDPYDPAKAQLGHDLFFDPRLSQSGTMSCATCHDPAFAWSGSGRRKVDVDPGQAPLQVPTLLDLSWSGAFGAAGRTDTLEAFIFVPINSPAIMNRTDDRLLDRLMAEPAYADAFARVFRGQPISRATISQAIATYVRTIVSTPAPFDRWVAGDPGAVSEAARRGFLLFNGRAGCSQCHSGWTFTDSSFHDIGVGDGPGRGAAFPGSVTMQHAYKVPTLRDVERRAPYMHDGSLPSLEAVVELYDRGGTDRPSRSRLIHPLNLSRAEKSDLVAFLQTLSSEHGDLAGPALVPLP